MLEMSHSTREASTERGPIVLGEGRRGERVTVIFPRVVVLTRAHQLKRTDARMELDEYQKLSARTLGGDRTHEQQLANAALGLTGEAGEVAEVIKKHLFHARPLDTEALTKELGDCLWYIAAFGTVLGLSLSDIAERNVEKLRKRYPEGFSSERSNNRVE
jgi:NTP pyrophosphatase (non-canonical NTP hydrolase)